MCTVLLPPDVYPTAVNKYISYLIIPYHISLIEQQFVITHTICQTEIPALLDRWVTNTSSVKMLWAQKNCCPLHFCNRIPCLSVGLLTICYVLSVSCKTVYRRVMTNCCFMSGILLSFSRRSNTRANRTPFSLAPSTA